jgi:transposase
MMFMKTMGEKFCPQSFHGFTFDDVKHWMRSDQNFQPVVHNDHIIFLQFRGWSINLYRDGSYAVEVTEGG